MSAVRCRSCTKPCNAAACDIEDTAAQSQQPVRDVVIVGAGVVGCSIARALSRFRLRVTVVEKADDVAAGASKANSGIVHGGYDERNGTIKSRVAHKGNQMFAQLNSELNFGFRVTGSLVLAFSDAEVPHLQKLLENGVKNGVPDLRIIRRDEIVSMESNLNPDVVAALHCPHTGITSPYEYTIALAENAITNGVEFLMRHEVTDIQRLSPSTSLSAGGARFIVRAGHDLNIPARYVVNAAGLFSDKVASMVGAQDFTIRPRKGEYVILDRSQGSLVRRVLFPVPTDAGKGILVSPTFHGNLLLGPTSRDTSDPQMASKTNEEVLHDILFNARRSVPSFDVHKAITSYAGLRAKSDRGDFIIEQARGVPGFINVAGIDSPGLTASPAVALMVVDILRDAGLETPIDPHFVAHRDAIIVKKSDQWAGSVDETGDPRTHMICRCERVSEAEIVDAVWRPLGAQSTDAVKKRTRAGMGWCQGSFCESRVAGVVARELRVAVRDVPRRGVGSSLLPHKRLTEDDRDLLDAISRDPVAEGSEDNDKDNQKNIGGGKGSKSKL